MEIITRLTDSRVKIEFKIDLIVWKCVGGHFNWPP